MKNKLRILHLEDLKSDAELVQHELKKGNLAFELLLVDSKTDFIKALDEFLPDIILSDHSMPSFNSIEALKIVRAAGISIPFILVTATVSEEFAVLVLQQGADDYILKDKMHRLSSAIEHAISQHRDRFAKQKAEEELLVAHQRLLFHLENSPLGYIEWDNRLKVKAWSKRAEEIFGWTIEEFNQKQKEGFSQVYIDDQPWIHKVANELLNGAIERGHAIHRNYTSDGRVIWCEFFHSVLKDKEGKVETIMSLVKDITARKEAEQALINNELRFREFFETAPEALFVVDPVTLLFKDHNENALKLVKYSGEELLKRTPLDISPAFQPDGKSSEQKVKEFLGLTMQGAQLLFDWVVLDSTGKKIFCEARLTLLLHGDQPLIRASVLDVTERVELEKRLANEKQEKQREITEAVITAQENERSFLGEELHDNINQILAASKLYIDYSMKTGEVRKDLIIQGREYIISAMEEIRKLSSSLLPPSLGEISLKNAIDDLLEMIGNANKLTFIKKWHVADENKFSEKLKLTIFRIIQEQLNNIIKHADAKKVTIGLTEKSGILLLSVKDDGKGFDTSARRKGVGLKNIMSRTSFFNGEVTVDSEPGKGCELLVKFNTETTGEEVE